MDIPINFSKEFSKNHPDLKNGGLVLIANVGRLEPNCPFDLGNGLQFDRPTEAEVETIRALVMLSNQEILIMPSHNPYEVTSSFEEQEGGAKKRLISELSPSKLRYHIIRFSGTNRLLYEFVDASILSKTRLISGPSVMSVGDSDGLGFGMPLSMARAWKDLQRDDNNFISLSGDDLADLQYVYEKLTQTGKDAEELISAMNGFRQLDEIPRNSPLRFLGYVSILESLLTHAPDPKDPYDSLTRQVRQKMLLVSNRAYIKIPYELFQIDRGKLWSRLYEYRSIIAHGGSPDFKNRFQCLNTPETALKFIECATISLMRQTLEEPSLIYDLRAC